MSIIYLYDGTFEGLITSIYDGFYSKKKPSAIINTDFYIPTFFDETIQVFTDQIKVDKVLSAVRQKLGEAVFQTMLYAFFSEDANLGTILYRFAKVAFKIGPNCLEYRAHEDIGPLLDLQRKVSRESHLLLGLIRFVELESGLLYSQFEGSYDVLTILGSHFFSRLSGEKWILHDLKRSKAIICNGESWFVQDVDVPADISLHEKELLFQDLWKTYFKHIAIQERVNPKLQMQNMPKKYWKYLIEKNENTHMGNQNKLKLS